MSEREIVTLPHPTLRRKARKVTDFGPELQTLIDDMVETMRVAPGVGLAANQINVPLQVIVVEYQENDEDENSPLKLYTVVNPTITHTSPEVVPGVEGCLSVPGVVGEVDRHEAITVKAQNRRGQPLTLKPKGWLARIFQHEIDHLQGVVFVDRAEKLWQIPEGEPVVDNV